MKKLPVGIQSFEKIRMGGYLYVDKTEHLFNLTKDGSYYFLSRPRRFGKSLMVNTLAELFRGKKELFDGLWIEDRWDWSKKNPVIQIGFSSMGYKELGLERAIAKELREQANDYGITLTEEGNSQMFQELLETLSKQQGPVVVLIDEYDKPIIDFLEDPEKAKAQRDILKTFYSVLKDMDDHLRMVFITGVSKFSRTSIFSELNNLTDLSTHPKYADMLGYTQTELEANFADRIETEAGRFGGKDAFLAEMREWYNGYSWDDGGKRVYNPFSTLSFFDSGKFKNFWFETGTPTFLIKLLDRSRQYDLEEIKTDAGALGSFDLDNISAEALLFQTGYITLKEPPLMGIYTLGYPNREVRDSMLRHLLAGIADRTPGSGGAPALLMAHALFNGDMQAFETQVNALLAGIPYGWHQKSEAYYHTVMHLAFSLIGVHIQSEIHTAKGRLDSVIHTEKTIYVVEFKVDKSAEEALAQIREKGYAGQFKGKGKPVVGIGLNFSSDKKEVDGMLVEAL